MKKVSFFVVLFVISGISGTTLADIIPGGVKPGFIGNSVTQLKEVGEESFLEEFVMPNVPIQEAKTNPPDKTLSIDGFLSITAKKEDLDFTKVEAGDSWWEVSFIIFQGEWNHLFIQIKGEWNPARDTTDDRPGRSLVMRIGLIPLTEEVLALYDTGDFGFDMWASIRTRNHLAAPAKEAVPPSVFMSPVTLAMNEELEYFLDVFFKKESRLATTWGNLKQ